MEYEIRHIRNQDELDALLQLRHEVFVQEQGIPAHLDNDGLDDKSLHVAVKAKSGAIIAGGRLSFSSEPGLGILSRIVVKEGFRGKSLGAQVIKVLEALASEKSLERVQLKPHAYLEAFYQKLGYKNLAVEPSKVGDKPLLLMEKSLK